MGKKNKMPKPIIPIFPYSNIPFLNTLRALQPLCYCFAESLIFVEFFHESLSVCIRVHPCPIRSFFFDSLANKICVYLCSSVSNIKFLVAAQPRCALFDEK